MVTERPREGRSKRTVPTASIRYGDGSTREFPFAQPRLRDFTESEPWRRVRSVHGMAHYSGDYASSTTGGQVVYESRLELARLLLADFDPVVCGIFAQPCRMVARIDGKVRSHVPDLLLVMGSIALLGQVASIGTIKKALVDQGFKKTVVEIVERNPTDKGTGFVPQAKRWIVEQTLGILMLFRRLVRDYEGRPASSESRVRWAMIDVIARRLTGQTTPTWRG
ncbi:hypothetical protein OHA04_12565 [Streptomyces sp. NBC_01590]